MNSCEKKYISDEIRDLATAMQNGYISSKEAAAKLWQLANELRNELKEDAQK